MASSINMVMRSAPRIVLRLVTAAAAGVAAVVMATSQEILPFGFQVEATFQDSTSLVFFVAANVVACAYNLIALIVPPTSPATRYVLMVDVVVGMVLTGALGAAGAISDLGKNGSSHFPWPPICDIAETFCDHVGGALIAGLVAVILYFLTLMYSIYTFTSPNNDAQSPSQQAQV